MSYNSKYTGAEVEALLDKVGNTYTKTESDELFATKTEVNEAIANAITTTLNTEV